MIAKKNLLRFPIGVIQEMGYALHLAQEGMDYHKSKIFKGHGSGVYELAIEYDKEAYRMVYLVNFLDTVYVLHSFQKKSKIGIKTPKEELALIKQRLKLLRAEHTKR